MDINTQISEIEYRKKICWEMSEVFLKNRDAHGLHDMGVEIQALDRAINELKKAKTNESDGTS